MKRVILLGGLVAVAGALTWVAYQTESLSAQPAVGQPAAVGRSILKAVVHINVGDTERQKHALKNVTNMLHAEGGRAEIVVVQHGGGIGLVVQGKSPDAAEVERLIRAGVKFEACENTLRERSIPKESLLAGVSTVPSGAAEVVRRQQDGFGYFRP